MWPTIWPTQNMLANINICTTYHEHWHRINIIIINITVCVVGCQINICLSEFFTVHILLYIVGNRKISNGTNLFRHQAEPSVKNICLQKLYNYKNIYFSKSLFLTSSFKPWAVEF